MGWRCLVLVVLRGRRWGLWGRRLGRWWSSCRGCLVVGLLVGRRLGLGWWRRGSRLSGWLWLGWGCGVGVVGGWLSGC